MAKIERFEDIDAWQAARELMRMVIGGFIRYLKKSQAQSTRPKVTAHQT